MLDDDTAAYLEHALVTSPLDNDNALLYGISDQQLNKLKGAENAATRMLTKTRKFDHNSPVLHHLYWLPYPSDIVSTSNSFFSHGKLFMIWHLCVSVMNFFIYILYLVNFFVQIKVIFLLL